MLVLTRLVAQFGTAALAGYGIGSRLEFLLIPIAFAVGVACVPMVGMAIGANDVPRARKVAWSGGLTAAAMLGLVGLFFAIFPTSGRACSRAMPLTGIRAGLPRLVGLRLFLLRPRPVPLFRIARRWQGLGPVMAGTVRLVVVIAGGLWLASWNAPQWMMFVVVALSMAAYGLSTAGAIWVTPWGRKYAKATPASARARECRRDAFRPPRA